MIEATGMDEGEPAAAPDQIEKEHPDEVRAKVEIFAKPTSANEDESGGSSPVWQNQQGGHSQDIGAVN